MTAMTDRVSRANDRTIDVAPTEYPATIPGGPVARRPPTPSAGREAAPVTALLDHLGRIRARELVELRAMFNRPSQGGWGILHDPGHRKWIAVRGRTQKLSAPTAEELGKRCAEAQRNCHVAGPRTGDPGPAARLPLPSLGGDR
ncbi:MAG: hypothetical protein JWN52_1885 [Actinomycetia bacterium]|nr:hypothetical protein [Actinomycetes bacterium]